MFPYEPQPPTGESERKNARRKISCVRRTCRSNLRRRRGEVPGIDPGDHRVVIQGPRGTQFLDNAPVGTREPAERSGKDSCRQPAIPDLLENGRGATYDTRQHWPAHSQQSVGRKSRKDLGRKLKGNFHVQECVTNSPVCFENVGNLFPSLAHEVFLVFLDYLRTKTRRHARPRVLVEVVHPSGFCNIQLHHVCRALLGVLSAIQRHGNYGVARIILSNNFKRKVDDFLELLLKCRLRLRRGKDRRHGSGRF